MDELKMLLLMPQKFNIPTLCWQFHIFGGHGSCAALTQSPWICGCPIQPTDQGNAEAIITDIVETINNKKRERAN